MKLLQIDAFTSEPFKGNPAAVCFMDGERDDRWMANVAAEMNLAETAFLTRRDEGWNLRWFTPAVEVDLCGHATLASAHAIWSENISSDAVLRFHTKSGVLTAKHDADMIELDFPPSVRSRSRLQPASSTPSASRARRTSDAISSTTSSSCRPKRRSARS